MRRAILTLPVVALLTMAAAQPIDGWWVAKLRHGNEERDFYLRFVDRNGTLHARFWIPEIGAENSPLGPAKVGETEVELPAVGWKLRREADGTLTGSIPHDLVPHYELVGRFARTADGPPADTSPIAAGPPPRPLWQSAVGGPVYAGLAYNPRRKELLVGSTAGRLTALNGANGRQHWSVELGAPIRATPLVAGDALYVPTDIALVKLDPRNGKILWRAPFGPHKAKFLDAASDASARWDVYSSSAVEAGRSIIVGSRDGCIHVVQARDGQPVSKACSGDIVTSTPVVAKDRIFFGSFDGKLYSARAADGSIAWQRDMHGPISGDLALAGENVLAGSRSYDLSAFDRMTGAPVWTRYFWFSWVESSPNVAGDRFFIGSSDSRRVFAFARRDGKLLWATRVPGWTWPKPAIGARSVYAGVVGTARPYVGKRSGGLAGIDSTSGKLKWLVEAPAPKDAMFYGFAAAPIVAGGRLYAADLNGNVFAFADR